MSTPIPTIDSLPDAFAERFNAGDLDDLLGLFADDAVFVPQPGVAVTGADLRGALEQFLALQLPFEITVVNVFRSGDVALVIADWSMAGVGPDGQNLTLTGRTADVARFDGPALGWRYVVDNPFGTA